VRDHGHARGHDGVVVASDDPVRHGYHLPPACVNPPASSLSARRRQRRRRDRVAAGQPYREQQRDDEAAGAGEREAVGLGTLAWPAVAAFLHGSAGVLTIPAARGRLAWPRESEVTLGRWSWVWYITEQDV
jgi:hypothetical protein